MYPVFEALLVVVVFLWASLGGLERGSGHVMEVGDMFRVGGTARIMEARALRDGSCFRG
jgi:hypothetical protein